MECVLHTTYLILAALLHTLQQQTLQFLIPHHCAVVMDNPKGPFINTNLLVLMELLLQSIWLKIHLASCIMHIQQEYTEKHIATLTSYLNQGSGSC